VERRPGQVFEAISYRSPAASCERREGDGGKYVYNKPQCW
jgi:hypothetical protein